jgi:hypothetical protein
VGERSRVLSVRWTAHGLKSTTNLREGEFHLPLLVSEATHEAELPNSPYIKGQSIPVNRRDVLFGRNDVLARIHQVLAAPHQNGALLLEGMRRTGKTSVLLHIESDLGDSWRIARCNLQKGKGNKAGALSDTEVFRLLTQALIESTKDLLLPNQGDEQPGSFPQKEVLRKTFVQSSSPFDLFTAYLEAALEKAAPARLLLQIDEFDKVAESIEAETLSASFPENLRASLIPSLA